MLLVNIESKNKYSVYEMIPFSLKLLNNWADPFFNGGVVSLT